MKVLAELIYAAVGLSLQELSYCAQDKSQMEQDTSNLSSTRL